MVSLPYCDAGGPLADSCDIEKELVSKALKLTRNSRIKTLSVRSADQFADIDAHLTVNPNKARMILTLPDKSDKLLSSLKAKVRSQARKPIRDGLTVQQGGQELLHEFYPLFLENMRDLGSPVHSKKWIQSILQAYKNRSHLFIVRMPDNTPAAGGVLLCHPNTVSVPWASSLRRFNRWNPNMLLYWGFLKFAADNGYVSFDFGRSTPGEGTFRFKKQWGATPSYLHWAEFRSCHSQYNFLTPHVNLTPHVKQNKTDGSEARKLAESIIMKMPIPLFQGLGNITRKYIPL